MKVPQQYDALVTENQQLFDHEDYKGYLDKQSRKATANAFSVMGQDLTDAQHRLQQLTKKIAKNLSISIFNKYNEILKGINKLVTQLHQEPEYTLYQLPELGVSSCIEILELDQAMIQSYSTFRTSASALTNKDDLAEEDVLTLEEHFLDFQSKYEKRYTKAQQLGTHYENLQKKAEEVGNLIDERNLDHAREVVESMFEIDDGFLQPFLDLIDQFKNRQVFHSSRLEHGLQRDEQSLKYFDLYLFSMEQLKDYLEGDRENFEASPFIEKTEQVLKRLPNVRSKRDDMYEHSSPRDQEEEPEKVKDSSGGARVPVIALVITVVLVIVVLLIIYF